MPLSKKTRDKRGRSIALITETRIKTTQDTSSGHPAQCWFCKKIAVIVFLLLFFFNYPCLGIALGWAQGIQPTFLAEFLWVEVIFAQRWPVKFLGWSTKFYPYFWRRVLTSKKSVAEFSVAEVPKVLTYEKTSSQFSREKPTDAVKFRVPSKKNESPGMQDQNNEKCCQDLNSRILSMNLWREGAWKI